jgi:death-on-curing protein
MLFISIQDIMLMHDVLINRFGGSTGLRDRAGLEAALMRPQSGYHPDVIAQAAALF